MAFLPMPQHSCLQSIRLYRTELQQWFAAMVSLLLRGLDKRTTSSTEPGSARGVHSRGHLSLAWRM